jgi:hypothetical protein
MLAMNGAEMVLVIFLQVLTPLVTATALVVIAVTFVRRARAAAPVDPTDRPGLMEQRLEHLDRLHAAGRITDDERSAARARLLGEL